MRVAPDEISYILPNAWKDIQGHRTGGKPSIPKDGRYYNTAFDGVPSIIEADDEAHTRHRRLLSHAFSDRMLRSQEDMLRGWVDKLISKIREFDGKPIDVVSWFNFCTFDIIGDLTMSQPFGCLDSGGYHPWVAAIFDSIKIGTFFMITHYYSAFKLFLGFVVPKEMIKHRDMHLKFILESVQNRLQNKNYQVDFMEQMLKHNSDVDEGGISRAEIHSNTHTLILAGSETTATTLSGAMYRLSTNPDKWDKLSSEIRMAFKDQSEIKLDALIRLPYLQAIIEECLRVYPPVSSGLPRVVPKGGVTICGDFIPEGVRIPRRGSSLNFRWTNRTFLS